MWEEPLSVGESPSSSFPPTKHIYFVEFDEVSQRISPDGLDGDLVEKAAVVVTTYCCAVSDYCDVSLVR